MLPSPFFEISGRNRNLAAHKNLVQAGCTGALKRKLPGSTCTMKYEEGEGEGRLSSSGYLQLGKSKFTAGASSKAGYARR